MTKSKSKRLVLVLGAKGGVGKTLLCRILHFFYQQGNLNFAAFDADRENPEFQAMHDDCKHKVNLFDFMDVAQVKFFINFLEEYQPDRVVVDMPAASSLGVREQFQRFELLDLVSDDVLGYRVTLVAVLNNNSFNVSSFGAMMDAFGDRADYVAVLNQMWVGDGENFNLWHNSSERQQFEQLGGVEVPLPMLELTSFQALHAQGLPFERTGELGLGDRILIRSFLNRTRAAFEPAEPLLALPPLADWVPLSFKRAEPKSKKSSTAQSKSSSTKSKSSRSKTSQSSTRPSKPTGSGEETSAAPATAAEPALASTMTTTAVGEMK